MEPKIILYENFGNEIISLSDDTALLYGYNSEIKEEISKIIKSLNPVISNFDIRKKKLFGVDADLRAYYHLRHEAAENNSNFVHLVKGKAYFSKYWANVNFYSLNENQFDSIKKMYQDGMGIVCKSEIIDRPFDKVFEGTYLNKLIKTFING